MPLPGHEMRPAGSRDTRLDSADLIISGRACCFHAASVTNHKLARSHLRAILDPDEIQSGRKAR